MSQEEGCLSVIEPDMITKTMYGIYEGAMDTALWMFGTIVSVAVFALMAWSIGSIGVQIAKGFRYRSLSRQLASKETTASQDVKNTPGISDPKSQGLLSRLKLKIYDKLMKLPRPTLKKSLHHSEVPVIKKARNDITRVCAETTRKLDI